MCDKEEPCVVESLADGRIKLYSDGSIVREEQQFPPPPTDANYNFVPYKDIVFDHNLGLWARLYLPPDSKTRVPVLLYYHGDGFCYQVTPATDITHHMCQKWAVTLGVIIVYAEYRLAPKHRLLTTYHDPITALQWIDSMKREREEVAR
ncbi:hypothetical protein KI387_027989, partial [Taxus chinensis]